MTDVQQMNRCVKARGSLEFLAVRLAPGSDVRQELVAIAKQEKISAAVILSVVGSLSQVCLRFADAQTPTQLPGQHEVLTLSGTMGECGVHLHMTVANQQGECKGGHLVEGCPVYTTLEVVMGLIPAVRFRRSLDPNTGFQELDISLNSERS
jgi:uncharacterized protein